MADLVDILKALRARRPWIRTEARAQLCAAFEPLVRSQARSYRQQVCGADLEDLEQEARVGLVSAIETYDPKKGAFASHAMWEVRNALSKYVESLGNPVRIPAWMIRRLPKLRRMVVTLSHELLREPKREELAERMKLPVYAIETMLSYEAGGMNISLVLGDSDPNKRRYDNVNRMHNGGFPKRRKHEDGGSPRSE